MRPILITGAARSGTSMVAGVIDLCGAFGGTTSPPNINNRRGMFENAYIKNNIVKPYLRSIGCDPMGQRPLPSLSQVLSATHEQALRLRNSVVEVLKREGLPEGASWYYKCAKMCLVWYLWNRAFPEAQWIIVRRDDEDIINSCMKTGFMRAYNKTEGWRLWVAEHKRRFHEMKAAGLDVREVRPEKMVNGDFTEMMHVVDELGLKWNEEEAIAFITPALWSTVQRKEKG